jgi:bifunctional ADP-heptose synthase (sugar kinase/adenylyltransferase)
MSNLYRKKPVVIEAEQYRAASDSLPFVEQDVLQYDEDKHCQYIQTLEGNMLVSDGDWVIKGVKGEFYPCKPDIFAATYESVDKLEGKL